MVDKVGMSEATFNQLSEIHRAELIKKSLYTLGGKYGKEDWVVFYLRRRADERQGNRP